MKPISRRIYASLAALAWCGLCAAADPVAAGSAASYGLRVPVTLAPDAALQRLPLPVQTLVGLRAPGYADLRLFNAEGQAVAMALSAAPARAQAEQQTQLAAYPILGSGAAAGLEGLSLRIEESGGKRVVQLDTAGAATLTPPQKIVGVLLDARNLKGPAVSISLDADLPAGQPVTFNVQSSKDLKNWQPLAETVLYRADGAAGTPGLGSDRVRLFGADLSGSYLRVTWGDAAVTLRGASVGTSAGAQAPERLSATVASPLLTNAHEVSFSLPFATPVAALRIVPPAGNVLVPVRVLGRSDRSRPWIRLADAVVYRLTSGGKEQLSGAIELPGSADATLREIKIEADAKTPGFAAALGIKLEFEPVQIVFLAAGAAPFTLASGLAGAAPAYLPLASLMPGYQSGQENTLPMAKADAGQASGSGALGGQPGALITTDSVSDGMPIRSLILWGILIGGALLLALMAWVLLKQTRKSTAPTPEA
jgi:hypothetical protein